MSQVDEKLDADAGHAFAAIGVFRCVQRYPYDAARQGAVATPNTGEVHLRAGQNFEQALQDIDGFSHLWLVYVFHHNQAWKPLVQPPRGGRKVGVFASRAPYRPNPIGLSCVELVARHGLVLQVRSHDLLDGTPILDIKPYVPYADAMPDAKAGWLERVAQDDPEWTVLIGEPASAQLAWLREQGVSCLDGFLQQQLGHRPLDPTRKRLQARGGAEWIIAYRTWRIDFAVDEPARTILVQAIRSGYSAAELEADDDRYGDMAVHRRFTAVG